MRRGRINRVLLLSDGGANLGVSDPRLLAQQAAAWQLRGITTTTIGLGAHYNEDLMTAIARAGKGNFHHVQTPADIVTTFQVEMLGLQSTFGLDVRLGIEPCEGVRIAEVINLVERDSEGHLKLADLVHGCPIEVALDLSVQPHLLEKDLCRFQLSWWDIEADARRHVEARLRLPLVPRGQLSEFPVNPEVAQKRAIKASARFLQTAIEKIDARDKAGARAALQSGLSLIRESGSSPELADMAKQFQRLLTQLDQGDSGGARKMASYTSSSVSLSSVSTSRAIRKFIALPAEERTAERWEQLQREDS
jgi:Ca-activated chloride channel family protein